MTLRSPSFSTELTADVATCSGPIAALAASERPGAPGGGAPASYQLLCLSRWGQISMYSVQEVSVTDLHSSGGELGRGMRIGSVVRLVQTLASIDIGLQVRQAWLLKLHCCHSAISLCSAACLSPMTASDALPFSCIASE